MNTTTLNAIFNPATYLYVISNAELGLSYIGIHTGTWGAEGDDYMGSSDYLDAIRREFHEYPFTKELVQQFERQSDAKEAETDLILYLRETNPTSLINRSANDGMHQWEPEGYGLMTDPVLKSRLDKARRVVRPGVLVTGNYKNLILVKKENGTCHAPAMPHRDLTPIPKYKTWSPELLEVFYSLPPGCHHFATVLEIGKSKNYRPLAYVNSFRTEEEARIASSHYANLSSEDYRATCEKIINNRTSN